MKKDIEWLKEEIGDLSIADTVFISDGVSYIDSGVSVMSVYDLIDQLDEPEVLSQGWIDRFEQFRAYVQEQRDLSYGVELGATGGYTGRIANQYDGLLEMIEEFEEHNPIALQNLLVPTLSEMETDERTQLETAYKDILERGEFWFDDKEYKVIPKQELPVIPKYVAEYLDFSKSNAPLIRVLELANTRNEWSKWKKEYDWISANDEAFARAWLDGYTVEEEQKYYAMIKGHELITDEGIWDCRYWNLSTSDGVVFPSDRFLQGRRFLTKMTKSDWNKCGINDSNADFVKVEE